MIGQKKEPKSGPVINVGIYGNTHAGKTRFLFQLFSIWKRDDRLLSQSPETAEFLDKVRDDIEKYGRPQATAAKKEGISVTVKRGPKERPWQFVFRDLRGELLTDEIPTDGTIEIKRDGEVAKQVEKCNAFLFFFDPACSEKPADIEQHHRRELDRAGKFIEYVLDKRENHHLPIIFVLTHLDQWENDETVRDKADKWVDEVHQKLLDLYNDKLRGDYPKSIVDKERIAFRVSSVGKTEDANKELEKVVAQLHALLEDSLKDRRRVRKSGRNLLLGAVTVVVCVVLVLPLLFSSKPGGESALSPHSLTTQTAIAEMSEKQIREKLDELDRLLKAHPRDGKLPAIEDANKINEHLQWLAQRLAPDSDGMQGLSEDTQKRMRSAMDSVGEIVHEIANSQDHDPAELISVLTAYLKGLPDMNPTSEELAKSQSRYWEIQRQHVVEQLAEIIRRRHKVASPPIDTLSEVVSKVRDIAEELTRCGVFGPEARKGLVQEIRTVETFCEDRINHGTYQATFCVVSASYRSDKKVALAWRAITLQSPGQPPVRYGLKPTRKGENELSFGTKEKSYQITLGVGAPVSCSVSVYDQSQKKWRTLFELDLTTDQGPLAALGLPMIPCNQSEVTKEVQEGGMELKLKFSNFTPVPPLLRDAAKSAMERTP